MKCRTKRKPPAKFPMKLKSKPWVVFFSLPMNIKGRAALLSLAVHSESSWEGQGSFAADEMEMEKPRFVPGSCRAGDETGWHKCCWRCRCDTQQFHTPSQPFQPLPVCKYHLCSGKPDFQNSADVMRRQTGAPTSLCPLGWGWLKPGAQILVLEGSGPWDRAPAGSSSTDVSTTSSAPRNYSKRLFSE